MKGGRKKRLTPKYTPPRPLVTVEPEGYSRAEDFEYSKESRCQRARSSGSRTPDLHEEGEVSRSPSTSSYNDFVATVSSIEVVMDDLARNVERARREAKTREEGELTERLHGHLSTMQNVTEEFLEKLKQPQVDAKLEVFVKNIKHVLKTEEDAYNYFVRFGPIESILDEKGAELEDVIPRGCDIRVFFDSAEAVEKALKFKHEVVEVHAAGSRKVGQCRSKEDYCHPARRREDLYRNYSMAEVRKGMEETFEGRLNKRTARDSASDRRRENMFEGESGERKRQRSESPLSHCSPPSKQHFHNRSPSRSPVMRPNTRSPATRPRPLPLMHLGLTDEGSSGLNASEYWTAEFAELGRKNAIKKEEDRKEAWKVQSRLLALVNKSPSCPREEEVVILDADEQPDVQKLREEAKKLDLLEHAKEKAEYAEILRRFNIVEVPASQPACIEISDSD